MNIWVWVLLTKVVLIALTVTSVAVNSQYTLLVSVREERLHLFVSDAVKIHCNTAL